MDLGLRGKRCAVAAGSAGLGLALAQALAAEGAQVAICARTEDTLKAAAATFGGVPLVADLSDPEQARRFVERAQAELGGVDVLVTNAGGPPIGNFESSPFANYEDALRTNLLSAVAMCQQAVPAMKERRWGRVLAITSLSARRPKSRVLMTGMARAGLTAFLKSLSLEVAPFGVTVNSLQPGVHRTARLDYLYGDKVGELAKDIPTGALGRPEDFGQTGAFLCSVQARHITGSAIALDGGQYPALY